MSTLLFSPTPAAPGPRGVPLRPQNVSAFLSTFEIPEIEQRRALDRAASGHLEVDSSIFSRGHGGLVRTLMSP